MTRWLCLVSCVLLFGCNEHRAADPAPVDLPRVLLIGDSISIGYGESVRAQLEGVAEVHKLPIAVKSTTLGLAEIDEPLSKLQWDIIHFNWGLNDLEQEGEQQPRVPLALYEKNLRKLLTRLQETGADLIWASTTPVPEGASARTPGDAVKYNAAAARVMQDQNILFNDLYVYALGRLDSIQKKADVHFTDAGYEVLANEVARHLKRALAQKGPSTIETPEIVRILEKEQIESIGTSHSQRIYIRLEDGRAYQGTYVHAQAGKYAEEENLFDILNLVIHIKKKRLPEEVEGWNLSAE